MTPPPASAGGPKRTGIVGPWLLGLASSLSLLGLGLYVSFYPHEILTDWRLLVLFWVALALGAGGQVFFAVLSEKSARENEQKLSDANAALGVVKAQLVTQIARLEHANAEISKIPTLVRTQPPRTFLNEYGTAIESNIVVAQAALQGSDVEQQLAALRNSLLFISKLAALFDDAGPDDVDSYSANLMVFVPCDRLGAWRSKLIFANGLDDQHHLGVLALRRDLALVPSGRFAPLPKDFALTVPKNASTEEMPASHAQAGKRFWQALPGAPLAFARNDLELFNEPRTRMADWIDEQTDFPKTIAAAVGEYFKNEHTAIGGFLSMPVAMPRVKPTDPAVVVAVVNVDWTKARLLPIDEGAATFHRQLQPLLSLLALLVERVAPTFTPEYELPAA